MENLLAIFDKVQQVSPIPVFTKEVIVVQNAGMQHWLNLSVAQSRGIAFNIDYALPAQFLWGLVKSVAGVKDELSQDGFTREALCWRIDELLTSELVKNDTDFSNVTGYWCQPEPDELRRFQLACQIADLYEQYLVFRPDWIASWHKNECAFETQDSATANTEKWQAKLWKMLVSEVSYDPEALVNTAIDNLTKEGVCLPYRVSFFGINTLAPLWLMFINAISKHCEIHFYHLNPSIDYWGDIVSEKQAFKMLDKWTENAEDINALVGNPLLANLGQQGREFLSQLQEISTINIDVFEEHMIDEQGELSVLHHIQNDIFGLRNGADQPRDIKDNSVLVTSAHSALREVQGLHDWLLHQFNQDASLTPKDVLVMCPKIEDYAPYVDAVFSAGWQDLSEDVPPLPCSIADRVSKDAEPVVVSFTEFLSLPDSRFQVNQLISWLRIPQVQKKYQLEDSDIKQVIVWLEEAAIHWGLDAEHKSSLTGATNVSEQFTWQYGLSRLMSGFCFEDNDRVFQNKLLLSNVEGSDVELLSKLYCLIEDTQSYGQWLSKARTAQQWHHFLKQMVDDFFVDDGDTGFSIIHQAIEDLLVYCEHANYNQEICYQVVCDFLNNHFSQPDPGRQFMVGQITFCSMIPMRSIPFKIIAILGLNDGDFPRQRQQIDFDLMTSTPFRQGDRSRRSDDRYLFLEAIISARQSLYLSYQGRNIKNNKERQPSVVLNEFFSYLQKSFNWQFDGENSDIRQLPMQPFSHLNYEGEFSSFDHKWLNISKERDKNVNQERKSQSLENNMQLSVSQLVSFFEHPSRFYANRCLNLFMEDSDIRLEDVEPFAINHLDPYLYRQSVLENALLSAKHENVDERFLLSGRLPDLPSTAAELDAWKSDANNLVAMIKEEILKGVEPSSLSIKQLFEHLDSAFEVNLDAQLYKSDDSYLIFRPTTAKEKDFVRMYLLQLMLQLSDLQAEPSLKGYYFDTKNQKLKRYRVKRVENPEDALSALLKVFITGSTTPLLINSLLGLALYKGKLEQQLDLQKLWQDGFQMDGFGSNPYIRYFWPEIPDLETVKPQISDIYLPIYSHIEEIK